MSKPIQNVFRVVCLSLMPSGWALNHDHWQTEFTSCQNFCFSARTARVSRNNKVNSKFVKQLHFFFYSKWAAINNYLIVLKWYGLIWWINKAQKIKMVLAYSDFRKMSSPDGQKYPLCCSVKSHFQIFNVTHIAPMVFWRFCPRRAGQGKNRNFSYFTGSHSMCTYLGCKWMRCINNMRNLLRFDKVDQTFRTAKTTDSNRQRLWCRTGDATCERNNSHNACDLQFVCECRCLGRAAEKKYVRFDG